MLFDDLPARFEADELERACAYASEIEGSFSGTLQALGEALTKSGTDIREHDDRAGLLLITEGLVCQLWLGNEQAVARWGGVALGPMMEMGEGVFPAPVSTFPLAVLPYFDDRAAVAQRHDVAARYHDFLWLHRRRHEDARQALRAYLRAGSGSNPADTTGHMAAASYLIRAAQISLSMNFDRADTASVLIDEMRRAVKEEGGGFVEPLAQHLGGLVRERPAEASRLLDELTAEADASTANPNRQRSLLRAVEAIARAIGRGDAVDRSRRSAAESLEREATARVAEGSLIETALLRDALRAFERLGDGPAVQRLKARYGDAAARAAGELTEISAEVTIPTELLQEAVDRAVSTIHSSDVGVLRLPLALGIWPRWEDVRARFEKARQDHPFQWLASRFTLTRDGRVSASPEDEEDREDAMLSDYFTQEIQLTLGLNLHLIEKLREADEWSAGAVLAALRLADAELAIAADSGVRAFEAADYLTAAHVLVPQFERGLRRVALRLSANVRRLVTDQGLEVATLGPILSDEAVIRFLTPNVAQTLVAVFVTPRGLNIRNNTAHGLLDPEHDQSGTAFLALMGVLTAGFGLHLLNKAAAATAAPPGDEGPPADG
jgi:lysyl-tRNA synthetase class 1